MNNGVYKTPAIAPSAIGTPNPNGDPPLPVHRIQNPESGMSVPNEAGENILVGAAGKLFVPREAPDAGLDAGTELDLTSLEAIKIRKLDRHEWVILNPRSELTTMLLPKMRPNAIESDYFFVDNALRAPICDEIKLCRVFVYYSLNAQLFGLWVVKVTTGNSWYESVAGLFKQPQEFFQRNAIRVTSERNQKKYRIRYKQSEIVTTWPTQDTGELLGQAIGIDNFIKSAEHPVYRELIDGETLD